MALEIAEEADRLRGLTAGIDREDFWDRLELSRLLGSDCRLITQAPIRVFR
jgi:hypothetical protein